MSKLNIVFDGPPGPECGRFVEVEDEDGRGVAYGEWIDADNGLWYLQFDDPRQVAGLRAEIAALREAVRVAYGRTFDAIRVAASKSCPFVRRALEEKP